jgi:hypothetical protein
MWSKAFQIGLVATSSNLFVPSSRMDGQSTFIPSFFLTINTGRIGGRVSRFTLQKSQRKLPPTSKSIIAPLRKSGRRCKVGVHDVVDGSADEDRTEYPRIAARITEGEAKRTKRDNLEYLLGEKVSSVRYPMQELELNYPTTKGKVYSEEEDRYLLCRLFHYGMQADDVYERIKKDITEFPVFRFDWFFKSRSPQELQRRCNTLLGMIEKEAEVRQAEEAKAKGAKGKVSWGSDFNRLEFLKMTGRNAPSTTSRRSRGPPRPLDLDRRPKDRRRRRRPSLTVLLLITIHVCAI